MIPSLSSPAIAAGADTPQHRRLVDAAQQFEGIFLQQMLKPIGAPGKGDFAADSDEQAGESDALQSYGSEAMAKAISAAGGLGIAREVLAKLDPHPHRKEGSSARNL